MKTYKQKNAYDAMEHNKVNRGIIFGKYLAGVSALELSARFGVSPAVIRATITGMEREVCRVFKQ